MKRTLTLLAACALTVAAVPSMAQEALAQKSGCLACHAIDKKVVGPAYRDVAEKYRGDKNAENNLVRKVLDGSSGVWGQVPMPPNPVSEAEAHTLVKWVLSQK